MAPQPPPHARRPPRWRQATFVGAWIVGASSAALALLEVLPGGGVLVALTAVALGALTLLGAVSPRVGFLARPLNALALAQGDGRVALTFDDGPDPQATPRVLELLERHGQRATFFVIGERAGEQHALLRRIVREGHEVANHTMRHRWHTLFWHPRAIAAELEAAQRAIEDAGVPAPRFMRPPVALLSPRVARGAQRAGLELVGYSARAFDAAPGNAAIQRARRLVGRVVAGDIVVLHDRSAADERGAAALDALLADLTARGLRSVPLAELAPAHES